MVLEDDFHRVVRLEDQECHQWAAAEQTRVEAAMIGRQKYKSKFSLEVLTAWEESH